MSKINIFTLAPECAVLKVLPKVMISSVIALWTSTRRTNINRERPRHQQRATQTPTESDPDTNRERPCEREPESGRVRESQQERMKACG